MCTDGPDRPARLENKMQMSFYTGTDSSALLCLLACFPTDAGVRGTLWPTTTLLSPPGDTEDFGWSLPVKEGI